MFRGGLSEAVVEHGPEVTEVTLATVMPYYSLPILGSAWWGERWISSVPRNRDLLRRAGIEEADILWISDPTMLPVLDLIRANRVVVRFFDHVRGFRGMPRSIFHLARRYVDRADLVVSTSESVREELESEGISSRLLQNAANPFFLQQKPVEPDPENPRAVYVGAVDHWFDFEALRIWAEGLPHWTFDIFGPMNTPMPRAFPSNVNFLGPIPHARLPMTLERCTFGMIPFVRNEFTDGIHPIKLYDYLSLGCRVLSAALSEVRETPGCVWTYDSPAQGLEILKEHEKVPPDTQSIRQLASENSWATRLDPILDDFGFNHAKGVNRLELY
jgi:hypothetical protein